MSDLDYDRLSPSYGERYRVNALSGVERAVSRLVDDLEPAISLEVGCGTGRWLPILVASGGLALGVDPFPGMLANTPRGLGRVRLLCADGDHLPFAESSFDLIVSINAIHHLADPCRFVGRCFDHLTPGGQLALVHYDPRRTGQSWYVYDYFEGARESDFERFPREEQLVEWMLSAGFEDFESTVAETIERRYGGREALDDYFLGKDSNSTLARLGYDSYARGLSALRDEIALNESRGDPLELSVRLELLLLSARRP